jgi:SNF2 family DNA or RNA helicase
LAVINKQAIEQFRYRKLDNHDWVKTLPEADLDGLLLEQGAVWHTEPFLHQKACLLLGLHKRSFYFLLEMGLGKSKIFLDIFQTRKKRGEVRRGLILVPGISNIGAWLDEIQIHAPKLVAVGLSDPKRAKRIELLNNPSDLVVATYAGWIGLLGMRKLKKGSPNVTEPWQRERIERMFQMVGWDEASLLKSSKTKFYRSALRLANRVPYRYALSGTPFHKNPEDLWSQFHVLDSGEALGETLTLFRSTFCKAKFNPFSKGFDYRFDSKKLTELTKRLRHTSIRYSGEECSDLPPTVGGLISKRFMCRPVAFPAENEDYYRAVVKELKGTGGNSALIKNVYIRLRQLTAGFIPIRENGQRVNLAFAQNPKLEASVDLLSEIPEDRKVLLFNEFRTSGDMICARLEAEKISHLRLYGGTKDKIGTLKQFKEDPSVRVLVASRSVCYGVNLQVANYLVIYESPDSTILRTQLERRIARYGQKEHTYIYDITMRDSVDVKILHYLRLGKNLFDVLIDSKNPEELMT